VRRLLDRLFTVGKVREMTPYMERIANELIDGFAARGSCEFVRDFAHPLPMMIIADQIGVPREDIARFKAWSDAIVEPFSMMVSPSARWSARGSSSRCSTISPSASRNGSANRVPTC
jgi:cytochrome P450